MRPEIITPIIRKHFACVTDEHAIGKSISRDFFWRQIWRVTGRESGLSELLESPRTSLEVSRTSPEVFGDFPGSSLTVELNSIPEVPRKFPRLPRKFPGLPRRSAVFLGSLTPSSDSHKPSLILLCVLGVDSKCLGGARSTPKKSCQKNCAPESPDVLRTSWHETNT